jgi:hypothetical protein
MKLNDEAILESLHLDLADLSAGRRLVKEAAGSTSEEDAANLTHPVLEVRGILSRPPGPRRVEALEENTGPVLTHANFLSRSPEEPAPKPSVIWVPVVPSSRDGFDVLQKFEGSVLSVTSDSFVARLVDKTNPGPEEEAEIPLAEIMPGDHELVKPGAVFYWVMGYERKAHGQLCRSSMIRFQRLPSWSPADVARAKKAAETFLSFLDQPLPVASPPSERKRHRHVC